MGEQQQNQSEMACVYAALILADDDVPITVDKISAILKAANINFVEPFWPAMFARALDGQDVKQLLNSVGSGVGAAAATATPADAAGAATKPAAAEEKKEEPASETDSDEDMGLDLFG